MTYDESEASIASSKPIELYDFAGSQTHWRYTSSSETQQRNGFDFEPDVIERKAVEITNNPFKNIMEIKLGRNNPFAILYISASIENCVTVTIYRYQENDYILYWTGLVQSIVFDTDGIPTITATQNTASLSVRGKRRRIQILCDLPLYEAGCYVNEEAFKVTGVIETISGKTISSAIFATKPDGWFVAGKLKVGEAYRLIKSHVGNTITISRPLYRVGVGNSFTAYAGCDHTMDTCYAKFANVYNYGGNAWMPTKNPLLTGGLGTLYQGPI
jgi:uncharacterized phage protein (TIGR02218 family)